jgi:glycerate kinase
MSSVAVCHVVQREWQRVCPEDRFLGFPLADGGEGTVDALVNATGGRLISTQVAGPLGDPVDAVWGILGEGQTAIIEMAAASGLTLVEPCRRDPRVTSTFGTGQLIAAAMDEGCSRIIVGIGGSATNDGGAGMARALGVRFLDDRGTPLPEGGATLSHLSRVDTSTLDPRAKGVEFIVACDVDNPLVGPEGASVVYGPQKGATPQVARELDEALGHYGDVLKEQLGVDVLGVPGAGAAGGLGAGLMAFLGARMEPGAGLVIRHSGLPEVLSSARVDLIITGEGEVNAQTARGKVACAVARLAQKHRVPVVLLAGAVARDAPVVYSHGIDAMIDATPRPMTAGEAMALAEENLGLAVTAVARLRMLLAGL